MAVPSEYHDVVNCSGQTSILASKRPFALLLLPFFVALSSSAQINGAAAASSGSAHAFSGAPPTGSVAPRTGAVAPPTGASFYHSGFMPTNPGATNFNHAAGVSHFFEGSSDASGRHHSHHSGDSTLYYPYIYPVAVPYAADVNDADTSADTPADDEADYQGGPTIFDRRGAGAASYVPPEYDDPAHASNDRTSGDRASQDWASNDQESDAPPAGEAAAVAETPQIPTILAFKDGHQLEIGNYAIIGQTLYDVTIGRVRRIAVADLDLPATQKQNDDRGVDFRLPPSTPGD